MARIEVAAAMTSSTEASATVGAAPIVGVLGAGAVGRSVGRMVRSFGHRVAWYDRSREAADRARLLHGGIVLDDPAALDVIDVVVICIGGPHFAHAESLISSGCDVVSIGDDHDDVMAMLELHGLALAAGVRLVVGAALSPGLSGLLAGHLVGSLAVTDEIHVAMHGTGGPSCARQHHDALGGRAQSWHDGEWVESPGGSGRELCWFPEPVGSADCYRADLADPVLLHRAFPEALRISARVSATRRDRLTSRLPMLTPPRAEGDRGAVRVEVRGALADGARQTLIVGAVGRTGDLAGSVGASYALSCLDRDVPKGVSVPAEDPHLGAKLLRRIVDCGVALHEYSGISYEGV